MQRDARHREADYQVQVGHNTVLVQGNSVQEAVRQARLLLCRELPRMWDVIQTLDDSRFRVRRVA